jgi:3-deoxy-7-phosphoheptulonate synthase
MASGLSMPVGYKNGTDGNISVAVNGMNAAQGPHRFLGIDDDGHTCIICTRGNPWGHLILRGGYDGPNYDEANLAAASELLSKADLRPRFMVDCSHANSNKDYRRQSVVWNDVLRQRIAGNETIVGLMLESHLNAGQQKLDGDPSVLEYGVSITDGCLGWDETEQLISTAYDQLA